MDREVVPLQKTKEELVETARTLGIDWDISEEQVKCQNLGFSRKISGK